MLLTNGAVKLLLRLDQRKLWKTIKNVYGKIIKEQFRNYKECFI